MKLSSMSRSSLSIEGKSYAHYLFEDFYIHFIKIIENFSFNIICLVWLLISAFLYGKADDSEFNDGTLEVFVTWIESCSKWWQNNDSNSKIFLHNFRQKITSMRSWMAIPTLTPWSSIPTRCQTSESRKNHKFSLKLKLATDRKKTITIWVRWYDFPSNRF